MIETKQNYPGHTIVITIKHLRKNTQNNTMAKQEWKTLNNRTQINNNKQTKAKQ
jgi:hypothetical protein